MEFDPQRILRAPIDALRFIGQRMLGGGWSDLPHPDAAPASPPVRARIDIIESHMGD